jgi:hypothetical protein
MACTGATAFVPCSMPPDALPDARTGIVSAMRLVQARRTHDARHLAAWPGMPTQPLVPGSPHVPQHVSRSPDALRIARRGVCAARDAAGGRSPGESRLRAGPPCGPAGSPSAGCRAARRTGTPIQRHGAVPARARRERAAVPAADRTPSPRGRHAEVARRSAGDPSEQARAEAAGEARSGEGATSGRRAGAADPSAGSRRASLR